MKIKEGDKIKVRATLGDSVDKNKHYITDQKVYTATVRSVWEDGLFYFNIIDDNGDKIHCVSINDDHLGGGTWTIE